MAPFVSITKQAQLFIRLLDHSLKSLNIFQKGVLQCYSMTKEAFGSNTTILDSNVWGNITVDDLKHDAEKALDVLIQQPEVDANHVTLVGHSEGSNDCPKNCNRQSR